MGNRRQKVAAAFAVASPVLALAPTGAEAAAPEGATQETVKIDRAAVERATRPAAAVSGAARAKVDAFLEFEARAGRPVDIASLSFVEVSIDGEGIISAIVPTNEQLEELAVVTTEAPDGSTQVFLGSVVSHKPSVNIPKGGPGFDAASGRNGMERTDYGCRTLYWDASYTTTDHFSYDCWEKWKDKNSAAKGWAYNRYTLFDPANGNQTGERGELVDATIRSRPWAGHEGKVKGAPYNYAPVPTETCREYTAGMQFNSGASLSIPLVSCNAKLSVMPNGTTKSMGTDYNGRTQAQVFLDYTFKISTYGEEPIYADYLWMEVQNCFDPVSCGGWNPSQYQTWKDAGW